MPPLLDCAVVLKTQPFRESSYILSLASRTLGHIHAIAKGFRRNAKGLAFLERGMRIETLVYVKPGRDLHTLGSIQITDFYPSLRSSYIKGIVRDIALELVSAAIHDAEPHPGLYERVAGLLTDLDSHSEQRAYPEILWRFLIDFAQFNGFTLNARQCQSCGRQVGKETVYVRIRVGGVVCAGCMLHKQEALRVPAQVAGWLQEDCRTELRMTDASRLELLRLTRLFEGYCRYHCEVRDEMGGVGFL